MDETKPDTSEKPAGDRRREFPAWLRVKTGKARLSRETRELVANHGLHTVCEGAHCPNVGECYSCRTAAFLILGGTCTRNCRFCAVNHGRPEVLDPEEPDRLAEAAADLGLRYVVVTSVTRDDLPDGGAEHFAATIRALRERLPEARIEVLTPDFRGDENALRTVIAAAPDVFNHNVETVRRLQPQVRPQAGYETSLGVLRKARELGALTKSGVMVGVGETDEEVRECLADLAGVGVSIVTIGQYLQPTRRHLPVDRYVPPEDFAQYEEWGRAAGIAHVFAGPFVRSSYKAAETAAALGKRWEKHHGSTSDG
jgi:lipoic acid synthetase